MFKPVLAILSTAFLSLYAAAALAAVDVNKADQAALESVKGIGPALSGKLLDERKKGAFKDWNDLIDRVGGVGPGNAAKFSTAGLTVNNATYTAPAAEAKAPKAPKAPKVAKAEKAEKADKPAATKPTAAPAATTK